MPLKTRIVSPGPDDRSVRTDSGQVLHAPADWELLPPGDATLTRRVKMAGPTWTVQQRRGRKVFSLGVWAPSDRIASLRADLETERSSEAYVKRRAADQARRERKQNEYVDEFRRAVLTFLDFAECHADLAERMADAVTHHATPVGSGSVARTRRIPVKRRAESAVIAWMRHQTTEYDDMQIPRVKGKRRKVRQNLAVRSRRLLDQYRTGQDVDEGCPLRQTLSKLDAS